MRIVLALLLLALTGCASMTSPGSSRANPSAADRPVSTGAGPDSTLVRQTGIGADQTVNAATGHL